jgi:hypothetical protein
VQVVWEVLQVPIMSPSAKTSDLKSDFPERRSGPGSAGINGGVT